MSKNTVLDSVGCGYRCLGVILIALSTFPASISAADNARLGLPALIAPADNPMTSAKIALGQRLFFDPRLSADGSVSCSTCHQPQQAFADGKALAQGIGQRTGTRNTPSLLNAAFNSRQFWDGRRPSLEAQALDPLLNPREHGLDSLETLLRFLRNDKAYAKEFKAVFNIQPKAIQPEHVAQALAAFQRTLIAGNSAFDRYQFKGEKNSLSPSAERGLRLFTGPAHCVRCHTIGEKDALFTDNQFHSLTVGLKSIEQKLARVTTQFVKSQESGASLDQIVLGDEEIAELGYFVVTMKPADIGKFRTPSLRNVALTAPYMHDGSIATLEKAIEWETYYRSGESARPLVLTPEEKADLVEFLRSLTGATATQWNSPAAASGYRGSRKRR